LLNAFNANRDIEKEVSNIEDKKSAHKTHLRGLSAFVLHGFRLSVKFSGMFYLTPTGSEIYCST
jgi:hypothetical protein